MARCKHEPVRLFDEPAKGNDRAAILYCLSGYTQRLVWVICRKCGETGYWGGYGLKRRVRWGYGDDGTLKIAECHNRQMRGETVVAAQL